jgi:serine/threonine-protein kinase
MARRTSGNVLSNRYELAEQLGAGGMAEVYLGRDRVLGRTVAVKTLLAQYAGDPHFIERFRREAQNAAALNHPNVVSVYDTGTDNGTQYIVMEYVEGRTLREVVREEGPLLPERAAEIAADVCAGLSFAHQHGIVHRDVKPANIMVTGNGAVKVADFGIARAVSGETVTQTAMVLGTAQYFSPEQAQSQPVDARSDIYSLGCVLYEMLTRQVPFTGSSPVAIAYKHVKEPPMVPSRLNPDVPPALEAIALKALAKNPNNRYQSADEMRADLDRFLAGRPVEATPVLSDATGMINPLSDETIIVEGRPYGTVVRRDRTPEEKRRRTGVILISLILALMVGLAAWAFLGLSSGASVKAVPNVVDQTQSKAQSRLEQAGFRVVVDDPQFSNKPVGIVIKQDPIANSKQKTGTVVHITPSGGQELVGVPAVVGKSESEARRLIEKAGFKVGDVTHESSTSVPFGRVIDQTPDGDAFAAKGSKVGLTVSSGKPTSKVPNVVGLTQDEACHRLEDVEGFRCQVVFEPQSPDCAEAQGNVCRQDPGGGSFVAQGSTVTIYVAEEAPSPTPTDTFTFPGSPSP